MESEVFLSRPCRGERRAESATSSLCPGPPTQGAHQRESPLVCGLSAPGMSAPARHGIFTSQRAYSTCGRGLPTSRRFCREVTAPLCEPAAAPCSAPLHQAGVSPQRPAGAALGTESAPCPQGGAGGVPAPPALSTRRPARGVWPAPGEGR